MAVKYYKNKTTGEIVRTLKKCPEPIEDWVELIKAPSSKMMVRADEATGKSKLKDTEAMLKERARNHSRETGIDDLIEVNREANTHPAVITQNCLNEKGERRKKLDDV